MQIVIPSANRAHRVFSKDYVPDPWRETLAIIVPPDQVEIYTVENPGYRIVACPISQHAGLFRQWIFDTFDEDPHLCMMDDDIKFFYRTDLYNSPKLQNILDIPEQQTKMFKAIERTLARGIPWTGISYRSGNNNIFVPYMDNVRSFTMWAIDRPTLLRHNIRFAPMRVMEDMWVILNLLTRGYKVRLHTRWAFNQLSNSSGGCSTWRTPQVQSRGARKLHRAFPDFVTVVDKTPKSVCWYGEGVTLQDVRVQWKKAYASAQK